MFRLYDENFQESYTLEELAEMMASDNMQTFLNTCAFLRRVKKREAYELLKAHVGHKDPYKRRYVLASIFHYPEASELVSHLEEALKSEKSYLVGTALDVIIQGKARVSDEALLACLEANLENRGRYACSALYAVEKTPENARRVLRMYHDCRDESIRIGLAEVLHSFCSDENHMDFYNLFHADPVPNIRILACRIAKDYHHPELLLAFTQDRDGHIRKLAQSK